MSVAMRCDRCGTMFLPSTIGVTDLITTIPEVIFQNPENYKNRIVHDRKNNLNLCPKCTNDFLKFMEDFENETGRIEAKLATKYYEDLNNRCQSYDELLSARSNKSGDKRGSSTDGDCYS